MAFHRPLSWRQLWAPTLGLLTLLPATARADSKNFEWDGKIYMKGLFCSDDSQGALWLSNPFWDDNIGGCNGVVPELELGIRAQISPKVRAGARVQSRWGAPWGLYWENGDIKTDAAGNPVPFPGDTSGESLGMNMARYMKMRSVWVEMAPPIPTVTSVRVGSSDFGMWSPWTIGRLRYIDRDNGEGVFVQGASGGLNYTVGMMAMPRLWAGPNWTTGIGDIEVDNPFITQDWAYGAKLGGRPGGVDLEWIATYMMDREFNLADPDAEGTTNPTGVSDGTVDRELRYQNLNSTLEAEAFPISWLRVNGLAGVSWSNINPEYAYNGVEDNQGIYPMVFNPADPDLADGITGYAGRLTAEAMDPFGRGLSFKGQYFNISNHWTSTMGSRREADVLLTDGFLGAGQLPTLNIANEFMDWDEGFFESIIGWHGGTLVASQQLGSSELSAEATHLTYNTNGQNWNVDTVYPDFLHTDGYTDVEFYDYANFTDRGRDPRSVFHRNQDRNTQIFVLKHRTFFEVGRGLEWKNKAKYIRDRDRRITDDNTDPLYADLDRASDDYVGDIYTVRSEVSYQFNTEVRGFVGDQLDYWDEVHRSGTPQSGYYDYLTRRNKAFVGFEYAFGGARMAYQFQWLNKNQDRFLDSDPNTDGYELEVPDYRKWNAWRSKVTFEVAW